MSLLNNLEMEEIEIKKDVNAPKKMILKSDKNLMEIIEKKDKIKKNPVATYLPDETLDKLKTVSITTGISISDIVKQAMINLTADIKIDEKKVREYDKKNKKRLRK